MTHSRSERIAGFAFVLAVLAAACSSGNSAPTASPLPSCSPLAIPAFVLVSPSPGATNVSIDLGEILFEGFPIGNVTLKGGAQPIALNVQPVPTTTPDDLLPQTYAALSAPLASGTTYSVSETYTNDGTNCTPWAVTGTLGSFTTQ
jgi:hypothetical protein